MNLKKLFDSSSVFEIEIQDYMYSDIKMQPIYDLFCKVASYFQDLNENFDYEDSTNIISALRYNPADRSLSAYWMDMFGTPADLSKDPAGVLFVEGGSNLDLDLQALIAEASVSEKLNENNI